VQRRRRHRGIAARRCGGCRAACAIPVADLEQDQHRHQRRTAEPDQALLALRHHDEGGQQWTRRLAEVAADLEQRLRQAVAAAGRHARHARSFGMKHRGAHADHRRRQQDQRIGAGLGHQQQAGQREAHADHQGIGLRPAVGVEPDQRLQHRGRALEGQRDQADLAERKGVGILENGIQRRHQRLHHVVQQMAEAEREDDREGRTIGGGLNVW
jgi:hypothetical protein